MALPQIKANDIATAIQQAEFVPEQQSSGDEVYCTYKPYIGDYLIGKEQESIKDEEVMIVVDTLAVGWILWHEGKCHEQFEPFVNRLSAKPPLPDEIAEGCRVEGDDWVEGRGLMFVANDGLNVVWKAATMGMRKAVDPIIMEIIKRASSEDKDFIYPKVKLNVAEPYKSKKGGMIYNPKLDIISWHNQEGVEQSLETVAIEEAPVRRRRKAA